MPHTVIDADVRDDLCRAQIDFVNSIGEPGTWWTGAERVAIAQEVRHAREHAGLPPWQAPSGTEGLIQDGSVLPDAAIDAVWRITNHPGTLVEGWYDDIVASITPHQYVELVGIVAGMNAVDRFADALDLDHLRLPPPRPGAPSQEGPDAVVTTHWVPTVERGGSNVLAALSAVPTAWASSRPIASAHYVPEDKVVGDLSWNRGILSRPQIELAAAVTSFANDCFY